MATTNTNRALVVGNLTRDPEEFAGGKGVKFSIACNESWFNKDKQEKDEYVNYFDIVVWGKAGEAVLKFCSKGSKVAVDGKLRQERWENDGQNRSRVTIHVAGGNGNVEFLTPKNGGNGGGSDVPTDGFGSAPPDDDDIPF